MERESKEDAAALNLTPVTSARDGPNCVGQICITTGQITTAF